MSRLWALEVFPQPGSSPGDRIGPGIQGLALDLGIGQCPCTDGFAGTKGRTMQDARGRTEGRTKPWNA